MSRVRCFKPLRLGAVFLCGEDPFQVFLSDPVSNPCASGRCSSDRWPADHLLFGVVSNPCASGRCSSALGKSQCIRNPGKCFKPLRLGAVFLCQLHICHYRPTQRVSNPCASGRCSSAISTGSHESEDVRFKPLRLGAVFLCSFDGLAPKGSRRVSNPCASGRCSSVNWSSAPNASAHRFQTPAPRGGVPLPTRVQVTTRSAASFKPLRLGAVFLCKNQCVPKNTPEVVSNPCASGRCSSGRVV